MDRCTGSASYKLDQNTDRKPRRTKKVTGDTDVCRTKLSTHQPESNLGGEQGVTQDAEDLVPDIPTPPQQRLDSLVSPQPEPEPQMPVISWAQRVCKSKVPAIPPCDAARAENQQPPPPTGAAGGMPLHPATPGLAAPAPTCGAGGGSFASAGGWAECGGLFLDSSRAAGGGGGGAVAAAFYALQESFFSMAIDGGGDGGDGGGGAPPGRSRLATYQGGGAASPARGRV